MEFLMEYSGQTTDELLALEGVYYGDSIALAFEEGLDKKWRHLGYDPFLEQIVDHAFGRAGKGILTEDEMTVLAIVSLQRQVDNGGFDQFFVNRLEFMPIVEQACQRMGRLDIAAVAREAVDSLGFDKRRLVEGRSYLEEIGKALRRTNDARDDKLYDCSRRFYYLEEDPDLLEVSLFNFIKANKDKIILPP